MVPIVARVATDGLGVEFTGLCVVSLLVGLVPSQSECFCHSGVCGPGATDKLCSNVKRKP